MVQGRQFRVAVVGSGLAGLVTAYLLHHDREQRYDVTVFEEVRDRPDSNQYLYSLADGTGRSTIS